MSYIKLKLLMNRHLRCAELCRDEPAEWEYWMSRAAKCRRLLLGRG